MPMILHTREYGHGLKSLLDEKQRDAEIGMDLMRSKRRQAKIG
jgi:hypothetical protein